MGILSGLSSPADLKALPESQLGNLAAEIRELMVEKVSATGGHLGPNLGVVELTIALHRVFNSPEEPIIFDTSHQSYVHKMLTGRAQQFDTLRKKGGLSGYTDRSESEHDWTESSHASSAISYADGLSKAFELAGKKHNNVVAVVGDGAMTGGMIWEALNNLAQDDRNVVVVINDNGRSYSPTIGGFARNLSHIRAHHGYDTLVEHSKKRLRQMGWVGDRAYEALAAFKEGVKSQLLPTEMFSDLGMKYVGPVNGHDISELEQHLRYAQEYDGPLLVHVVTEKGHGYEPAVNDLADQMHSTGVIDPLTGSPKSVAQPGWTAAFSDELVSAGEQREDIVAITAAMAGPTGLQEFADMFPDRFYDVGIAEAHAVTSAAGLALGGYHPVVALYSTFLNRAFDQLLMDVALLKLPVTLVLDRSGVTGSDGASHNGVWDMSLVSVIPGIRVAAPRDGEQLRRQFRESLDINDGPSVVRFPKGDLPPQVDAVATLEDGVDVLHHTDSHADSEAVSEKPLSVLVVSIGCFANRILQAVDLLADTHPEVAFTVVDPRWVVPVSPSLITTAADHDLVVTVEDGMLVGGIGALINTALNAAEVDTPVRQLAFPQVLPKHASRGELLTEVGLDPQGMADSIAGWIDTLTGEA